MSTTSGDDRNRVFKSRRPVLRLKFLFPAAIFLILAIIIYWPNIYNLFKEAEVSEELPVLLKESKEEDDSQIQNQARDLHFNGTDKSKQPYTLTAKEGIEYSDQRTDLHSPHLVLKLNTGQSIDLKADKATFYKEQQKIELTGHVTLKHTSGYEFSTTKAWMDLNNSSAFGHDPIEGHGPNGEIYAQGGFRLSEKGDRIVFNGRPELTLRKGK